MPARTPTDPAMLAAAARIADLPLDPERIAQLVPAMDGFYQLLDALHRSELGETPPAIAFRAKWEGR
ncbi:MAG: hypothetical protein RJA99_189 [Pseudomonadota bacterium]|jgi:hypothetical protein